MYPPNMPAPTVTPEQLHHALEQGWPVAVAARELGTTQHHVRTACALHGVELPRGVPRPKMVELDEAALYGRVAAGESLRAVARSETIPYATLADRLLSWAQREGRTWPPGGEVKPLGQRAYESYVRLRNWDAVAAEVAPESKSVRPGQMVMRKAKRWAQAGGGRAEWPIPR